MAQNYPYFPQQQQQVFSQNPYVTNRMEQSYMGIKGRPVSSIEEVRATPIDFDGSIFFFPDVANKKIYTKQINLDGTSTLNIYELKNVPIPQDNSLQFITREEFDAAIKELKEKIAPPQQKEVTQNNSKPILDF